MKTKKRRSWLTIFSLVTVFSLTVFSVSCKPTENGSSSNTPTVEEIVDDAQITLSQTAKNMLVGDTDILTVDYTGKKGAKMEWVSDNQSVVTVVDGNIEAVGEGTANVTVSCGKAAATCAINVSYGNTLPELVNGYGFEEAYTVYKNSSLHFTPAIQFRGKTYADGTFEMQSSNPEIIEVVGNELRSKSQIGEAVVTVKASWRKFNAANTVTLSKNFTVSVATSSYIALESGATNEIALYTLAEFEGETYKNSVDFVPVVYVDGEKLENATVSATIENENVASIAAGKLVGKQYGDTAVLLTCQNGNETYHKTISVHVNRPIANFQKTVKYFSALTGTYKDDANGYQEEKLASLFGENVTLHDAYCGEKELTVTADGRVLGVASDKNGVVESEITVGNLTWQYKVPVSVYGAYICEAEDLKIFQAVSLGANESGKSIGTKAVGGYCALGRDIDASGLTLKHGNFTNNNVYPNQLTDGGFVGTFDGQGHTIFNLTTPSTGLFSQVLGGTIKNVGFVGANFSGYYKTLFGHKVLNATIENVYIQMNEIPSGGYILANDKITTSTLTNVLIDVPMQTTNLKSGGIYSIANFSGRQEFAKKGVWTNVYVLSEMPWEAGKKELYVNNAWAWYDYLIVAENTTDEQIAAYWQLSVYSPELTDYETVKLEGVKSYANAAAMQAANEDVSGFNATYWDISTGVPVWKTK